MTLQPLLILRCDYDSMNRAIWQVASGSGPAQDLVTYESGPATPIINSDEGVWLEIHESRSDNNQIKATKITTTSGRIETLLGIATDLGGGEWKHTFKRAISPRTNENVSHPDLEIEYGGAVANQADDNDKPPPKIKIRVEPIGDQPSPRSRVAQAEPGPRGEPAVSMITGSGKLTIHITWEPT